MRRSADATTMVNIIHQVSASIGIATLSLLLSANLAPRPSEGRQIGRAAAGMQAAQNIPPEARAKAAGLMAGSFQSNYWWLAIP
jgi:hypothetical protein